MKLITVFLVSFLFLSNLYPEANLGFKKKNDRVEVNELEVFSESFFKTKDLNSNNTLVVIVKEDNTFFKVYPEHAKSFSELTRFDSQVFNEIFTTLSILQLQEADKLNIRGDIANYKWKYDKNFKQNILIENVLTHTTGIQENIIYPNSEKKRDLNSLKGSHFVRFSEPNEIISYNEDNLIILQTILNEVTGKTIKTIFQDSILTKLNLANTSFENEKLFITGKDLSVLIPIFLNPEDLEKKEIFKKTTWSEIFQEKIRMEDKLPGTVIGFFEHYENKIWGYSRIYESNQSTEEFIFFPDKNAALYFYTNSYNPSLRREFLASFLDKFYEVEKKKVKRDKSPGYTEYLQNFEGEYAAVQISNQNISKFRLYSSPIRIHQENKMLILESGKLEPYGDLDGRLEFIETEPFLFRCLDREAYISFKMNEAGDVEYLLSGSGQHGAYKKLTMSETKIFHENITGFFFAFYSIMFLLLLIELPYLFAKKIPIGSNRIKRNANVFLWLETVLALILFASLYWFLDYYKLMELHEYIIEGNPYDYAIFSIPFAFIIGMSLFTYYSLRTFLEKGLHLYRKLQYGLFLIISFIFIYYLSYWNLLSFGF